MMINKKVTLPMPSVFTPWPLDCCTLTVGLKLHTGLRQHSPSWGTKVQSWGRSWYTGHLKGEN